MSDGSTAATTPVEATAIVDNEGDVSAVVVEMPEGEGATPEGNDAVQIAQIEADTSVTIAAIHAETEQARIEAEAEARDDLAEMRERNTWLEAELASTQEQNRQLIAEREALTPPPSQPETVVVEEAETVVVEADPATMQTPTSETQTEPSNSTETEAPAASAVESPDHPPHRPKRRTRFL